MCIIGIDAVHIRVAFAAIAAMDSNKAPASKAVAHPGRDKPGSPLTLN